MRHESARGWRERASARADLPPRDQKILGREPVYAAEWLIEHGHHVDDNPDERREDAAKDRPDQDDGPDNRRDARPARLDARAAAVDELGEAAQRLLMQNVLAGP